MENLKLGRVRTRHIAYAQRGGKNEPIGEIDEAHLRAYVASLPGSYTVPNTPHDTGRSAGFARQKFNNAVLTRIGELRSANPELTELELHRLATAQVSKENPLLLSEYRADVQRV